MLHIPHLIFEVLLAPLVYLASVVIPTLITNSAHSHRHHAGSGRRCSGNSVLTGIAAVQRTPRVPFITPCHLTIVPVIFVPLLLEVAPSDIIVDMRLHVPSVLLEFLAVKVALTDSVLPSHRRGVTLGLLTGRTIAI